MDGLATVPERAWDHDRQHEGGHHLIKAIRRIAAGIKREFIPWYAELGETDIRYTADEPYDPTYTAQC